MFPTIATSAEYEQPLREQIISTSTELAKTFFFNFEEKSVVLSNGSPKLVANIDAIRQWITLFVITPKDVCKIYEGTGFGTSIRKLFGRKTLNNGYEEAEVEREIREGLPLCPAINRVTSFNLDKQGRVIKVYVQVELFDGSLIDTTVDTKFVIK